MGVLETTIARPVVVTCIYSEKILCQRDMQATDAYVMILEYNILPLQVIVC